MEDVKTFDNNARHLATGDNTNMRRRTPLTSIVLALSGLALVVPAQAIDHNNIDSGRPLRFDDAFAIAFRERAFEFGVGLGARRRGSLSLTGDFEYLYGIALNTHISIGIDPSLRKPDSGGRSRFDPGDASIGIFHNFNREIKNTPAFGVRADVIFPTGRDSRGIGTRLSGIMTKTLNQYDKLHVNVNATIRPSARGDERKIVPELVLGYSRPMGYPKRFDRTFVADLAVSSSEERGTGPVISAGIGFRQQVTVRSVFDIGLQSDVAAFRGAGRDAIRAVAGYSTAF